MVICSKRNQLVYSKSSVASKLHDDSGKTKVDTKLFYCLIPVKIPMVFNVSMLFLWTTALMTNQHA